MTANSKSIKMQPTEEILSPQDMHLKLHELRTYQIELEMQNEELRRIQAELEITRTRYINLYELAPVSYCTLSEQGHILQTNLYASAMLGVTRSELLSQSLTRFILPADQDIFYQMHREIFKSGQPGSCELRLVKNNGEVFWVSLAASAAPDDEGKKILHLAISDISLRKQAQYELQTSEIFKQAILDSMAAEIVVIDRNGIILAVNQAWRRFAQVNSASHEEALSGTEVGANYLSACHSESPDNSKECGLESFNGIRAVLDGRLTSFNQEYPCHSPQEERWFSMRTTPLQESTQRAAVITHTDITRRKKMEVELQKNATRFRNLFEKNSSVMMMIAPTTGAILDANAAAAEFYGYSLAQLSSMNISEINRLSPECILQEIKRALLEQRNYFVFDHRLASGEIRTVEVHSTPIPMETDTVLFSAVHDITQRINSDKQIERLLREQNAILGSRIVGIVKTRKCKIIWFNEAFSEMMGYTQSELIDQSSRLFYQDDLAYNSFAEMADPVLLSGDIYRTEIQFRRKDGSMGWFKIGGSMLDPLSTETIWAFSDITEQKQAEDLITAHKAEMELGVSRQRLRELAAQNEAAREGERKHIAREVHDELGQVMTALRMKFSLLGMRFGAVVPELLDEVKGMKDLVDRAIQGVRNLAVNLRPPALDLGLIPAIEWLSVEFTKNTGLACQLHLPAENIDFDEARGIVVFRIVQESLTNISRYAQASQVDIDLSRQDNLLRLQVRDNGCGFDLKAAAQRKSFGLLGMRERAIALGGRVEVCSTPGQGTVIDLSIPMTPTTPQGAA